MTTSPEQINIFSVEHNAHIYEDYDLLRRASPVYRTSDDYGNSFWVVTGYEQILQVLKSPLFIKDFRQLLSPEEVEQRFGRFPREARIFTHNMLSLDPPDHTRLRALISKAFTPRRVEELRPRIEQITNDLLDAMEGRTEVDLLDAFAFPLPIQVICDLLGFASEDQPKFRAWTASLLDGTGPTDDPQENRNLASREFVLYLEKMLEERRRQPGDDLVSALLVAEEQGEKLTADELMAMVWLLIIAGHETTVNLIANGMLALFLHPDQLAKLQQDPTLIKSAIEEFLRYEGPVELATIRYAFQDVELAGQQIKRGERVLAALAGGDHDPSQFPQAAELDITRSNNAHLAFGYGIHYCVGAPLARLEAQTAIPALLKRFPNIQLAAPVETLQWRNSIIIRGLQKLPVRLA